MTNPAPARLMVQLGADRYSRSVADNKRRMNEAAMPHGRRLIQAAMEPLIESIQAWLKRADSGATGVNFAAIRKIRDIGPDMLAFLTARSIVDGLTTPRTYTSTAFAIARLIEDECCFQWIKARFPREWKAIKEKSREVCAYSRKRLMIMRVLRRDLEPQAAGESWPAWSDAERAVVGSSLLDLFIGETKLVAIDEQRTGKRVRKLVVPTADTIAWLQQFHEFWIQNHPVWLPLVDPPQRWENPWGGVEGVAQFELVKNPHRKRYIRDALAPAKMATVYRAVNALQDTRWRVNKRVLQVMQAVWSSGSIRVGDIVERDLKLPLPPKPVDMDTNEPARRAWRAEARDVYHDQLAVYSKQVAAERLLTVAEMFRDYPAIHFPYQLDFRGRTYAVGTFLQPQGPDPGRALLEFADGSPIVHDNEADWLAVHGANLWGFDKVTFAERAAWVRDNEPAIVDTANDPLAALGWWSQADAPWQFLAFCFEWAEFLRVGRGFESRLAVQLDGSNNGLQILSLLTRDADGGRSTNVTASDTPQDIYGDVAAAVNGALWREVESGGEHAESAAFWLGFGVTRSTVKRSVMILPYGGSRMASRDYIMAWFRAELSKRSITMDNLERFNRVIFLADRVWEAIAAQLGPAQAFMDWLHEAARRFSKRGLIISWTVPTGFPVWQAYYKDTLAQVRTLLGSQISFTRRTDTLSPRHQSNGVSPNFVHSLDAAALHQTVALAVAAGIKDFAMIHDSFGCPASQVDKLAAVLRSAYAGLFKRDLAAELKAQLEARLGEPLPDPPKVGNLDPEELRSSEYFFS